MEYVAHDARHGGFARARIAKELVVAHGHVRLPLFQAGAFLLGKYGVGEVAYLLFHAFQSHKPVKFAEAFLQIHLFRLFVGDVLGLYPHHLVGGDVVDVEFALQAVALPLHGGFEQSDHTPRVSEILVFRGNHLAYGLAQTVLRLGVEVHVLPACLKHIDLLKLGG